MTEVPCRREVSQSGDTSATSLVALWSAGSAGEAAAVVHAVLHVLDAGVVPVVQRQHDEQVPPLVRVSQVVHVACEQQGSSELE